MSEPKQGNPQLEILVTEHERLLDQLNELLQSQQNQIDRLGRRLELIEGRLAGYGEEGPATTGHEPPPHY